MDKDSESIAVESQIEDHTGSLHDLLKVMKLKITLPGQYIIN